jgi:hypothetical protein
MSRRALIVALVAVLIASSMVVLGPSQARGASAAPAAESAGSHPGVTTITLATSDGSDPLGNITQFTSGGWHYPGYNVLYFSVCDPTADTSVVFTITDPNATRDAVGSPAYTATVTLNATTKCYYSWQTGASYTFPAALKIGGGWTVSASGSAGGTVAYGITVSTFYVGGGGTPEPGSVVLPAEPITLSWFALSDANGAPWSSITNVAIDGWYYGAADTYQNLFPGGIVPQTPTPLGSYTFSVPANATYQSTIYLELSVTIQVGTVVAENYSAGVTYSVGGLYLYSFGMGANTGTLCPSGPPQDTYASGELVQVCAVVGAESNGAFTPVAGVNVAITFWNGTATVAAPGNPPTSLVSNSSGTIAFSFWADLPPFSTYYTYPFYNSVNLTLTWPAAVPVPVPVPNPYVVYSNNTFYVVPSAAGVGLTVGLNQLSYYPGQKVTATWSVNPTQASAVGTVTVTQWELFSVFDLNFLAQGTIGSTADTGTFTVPLPAGFVGGFYVEVYASNATTAFGGITVGTVQAPAVFLNPSSTSFTPGSTITIGAEAFGDAALSAPTITYQVYANYGLGYAFGGSGLVASGTVANGSSFSISVPSTGAPSSYVVYGYLSSAAAGTVATTSLGLVQSWGYNVWVGVSTQSNYADGSFQPGQSITISYQISPYGNAPLPVLYTFEVLLATTQIGSLVSTSSTSGTVSFTIPSGWPSGLAILEVLLEGAYLVGNSCFNGVCVGDTGIVVNAHPSALSMELGAGSGLTVGWLILLIIVLVLFVVLLLLLRRKRTPPSTMATSSVTTPMAPPAPPPSSPGAAEWQEPNPPASGDQPPMPNPPPGAS